MVSPEIETIDIFNGKTIAKIMIEDYFIQSTMKVIAVYFTDGSKMRIEAEVEHTFGQIDDLKISVYDMGD